VEEICGRDSWKRFVDVDAYKNYVGLRSLSLDAYMEQSNVGGVLLFSYYPSTQISVNS
jgi:hypothetical protein